MSSASASLDRPAAEAARPRFSRPRFAALVLVGVYPIITLILYVILPLTDGWATWQRTLLIAPIMVGIMVWGLIPTIQQRFAGWINPAAPKR
ncbi:hypothetical protein [Methylobrevis albus]|uniref:Uncharacterized protein n=1 Tax=Methylobrevis albus TaxID=2793297 RepID=A0A931I152_9HYPH|nr:hypothetical protein [Methylobrevis albus]MBH0237346.1 hypothetical protein [Methylobrevis albus]